MKAMVRSSQINFRLHLAVGSRRVIQFLLRMMSSHTITMTSHHNHLYVNDTFSPVYYISFSWQRPTRPKRSELLKPCAMSIAQEVPHLLSVTKQWASTELLLILLSACAGPSVIQKELSSDEVEEEATGRGSKVRMQSHVATAISF